MRRFRLSLLRIFLSLAWLAGTGAMSLEAMLPDIHQPHHHQDNPHSTTVHSDDIGAHTGSDGCHCGHSHSAGLISVGIAFAVVSLPGIPIRDQAADFRSLVSPPLLDPPRI